MIISALFIILFHAERSAGELNNYNEKTVFNFINSAAKRNVSQVCGDSLTKVNTVNY